MNSSIIPAYRSARREAKANKEVEGSKFLTFGKLKKNSHNREVVFSKANKIKEAFKLNLSSQGKELEVELIDLIKEPVADKMLTLSKVLFSTIPPLVCINNGKDDLGVDSYIIVDGHTRLRALELLSSEILGLDEDLFDLAEHKWLKWLLIPTFIDYRENAKPSDYNKGTPWEGEDWYHYFLTMDEPLALDCHKLIKRFQNTFFITVEGEKGTKYMGASLSIISSFMFGESKAISFKDPKIKNNTPQFVFARRFKSENQEQAFIRAKICYEKLLDVHSGLNTTIAQLLGLISNSYKWRIKSVENLVGYFLKNSEFFNDDFDFYIEVLKEKFTIVISSGEGENLLYCSKPNAFKNIKTVLNYE